MVIKLTFVSSLHCQFQFRFCGLIRSCIYPCICEVQGQSVNHVRAGEGDPAPAWALHRPVFATILHPGIFDNLPG